MIKVLMVLGVIILSAYILGFIIKAVIGYKLIKEINKEKAEFDKAMKELSSFDKINWEEH